jgi:carbonic anhydrase
MSTRGQAGAPGSAARRAFLTRNFGARTLGRTGAPERSANSRGRMNADSDDISVLFENNRQWAGQIVTEDPTFFGRLAAQQKPRYLWIGCSDSRVPANQITGLMPGEVFVHRNVANVVLQTDLNCMSVVDFAIRTLQVRHVIICGHYGCAGVHAAMGQDTEGVIDAWLSGIRELWEGNQDELAGLDARAAEARLCELNVQQQVRSLCRATVIRQAWRRGQPVDVHGWVYGIDDGLLRDLGVRIASGADLDRADAAAQG